jgi:hypothetical protein
VARLADFAGRVEAVLCLEVAALLHADHFDLVAAWTEFAAELEFALIEV